MLLISSKRPSELSHIPVENHVFFSGVDPLGVYAVAAIGISGTEATFHLEVIRWTAKTLRLIMEDWKQLKLFCKKRGIKKIYAANNNYKDGRWPKFIKKFGFMEPRIVAVSEMEL